MSVRAPYPALAALRRFVEPAPKLDHCQLCGAVLRDEHAHLLDDTPRTLVCACQACALLFPETPGARYRRVTPRAQRLMQWQLTQADWDSLGIPVRLAFIGPSLMHEKVLALYPNPAGVTEADVPRAAWQALVEKQPALRSIEADVQGLLVDGLGQAGETRAYIVSVDVCQRWLGSARARQAAGPRRGLGGFHDALAELDSLAEVLDA